MLEKLNSAKFQILNNKQQATIVGGRETSAGAELHGVKDYIENGTRYRVYTYRNWTADSVDGNMTCYTGESFCDDVVKL